MLVGLMYGWLERQPEPKGEVLSGEAGFRLRRGPDSGVGIDVAYISAELADADPNDTTMIDGIPVLAAEVLSPNDVQEEVEEKIAEYLSVGVKLVWIIEPRFRTVTVYRPDAEPVLYNATQEITADPHLPGFEFPVEKLFRKKNP